MYLIKAPNAHPAYFQLGVAIDPCPSLDAISGRSNARISWFLVVDDVMAKLTAREADEAEEASGEESKEATGGCGEWQRNAWRLGRLGRFVFIFIGF